MIGDWVFGCDICQDVCPVNRKARPANAPIPNLPQDNGLAGDDMELDLVGLLELTDDEFRARFQGSPVARAKRVGLQRNACVALGNRREVKAVPALLRALKMAEPLVRRHAAWALGEMAGDEASEGLLSALSTEKDPDVMDEIEAAAKSAESRPGVTR